MSSVSFFAVSTSDLDLLISVATLSLLDSNFLISSAFSSITLSVTFEPSSASFSSLLTFSESFFANSTFLSASFFSNSSDFLASSAFCFSLATSASVVFPTSVFTTKLLSFFGVSVSAACASCAITALPTNAPPKITVVVIFFIILFLLF